MTGEVTQRLSPPLSWGVVPALQCGRKSLGHYPGVLHAYPRHNVKSRQGLSRTREAALLPLPLTRLPFFHEAERIAAIGSRRRCQVPNNTPCAGYQASDASPRCGGPATLTSSPPTQCTGRSRTSRTP